jgi:hypothetical protein
LNSELTQKEGEKAMAKNGKVIEAKIAEETPGLTHRQGIFYRQSKKDQLERGMHIPRNTNVIYESESGEIIVEARRGNIAHSMTCTLNDSAITYAMKAIDEGRTATLLMNEPETYKLIAEYPMQEIACQREGKVPHRGKNGSDENYWLVTTNGHLMGLLSKPFSFFKPVK